jgi:hypothetical protein
MPKRLTSTQLKQQQQRRRAIVRIGIVLALLAPLTYFYFRTVLSRPQLDPLTLCPPQPQSVTVLLVDVTDPMNLPQRQDFINQLETLIGQIPRYGKLVVTRVDPVSNRLLVPIITRCSPGSATDVSQLNGNPQQLERARQDSFLTPLRNAFNSVVGASGANRSPILESIQSVVLTELKGPGVASASRRLIVASDLLQNTNGIRFYGGLPDPTSFTNSQPFSRLRTDLRGIEVELWMLQRDDSRITQPRALPELWSWIIESQGGRLSRVYVVSG